MAIAPISGSSGLAPLGAFPPEPPRAADLSGPRTAGSTADGREPAAPTPELRALKQLAADTGLEVKFVTLPDSKAQLLRLVDPTTGRVMREFPPEGVAIALAELKAKAGLHSGGSGLDRQA